MKKYTIDNKTIYFSYNFNESLESYYTVLLQVSAISFINYECKTDFEHSMFNHPVKNLPSHIKSIKFGWEYNKSFSSCPNIEYLEFGKKFNQPIILGQKLKTLIFGYEFNQPIILTPNITTLIFGYCFNQHIVLTTNIQVLKFGFDFSKRIQLSSNIVSLEFEPIYTYPITITSRIKRLSANSISNYQFFEIKTLEFLSTSSRVVNGHILNKNIVECKIFDCCMGKFYELNKNIKRVCLCYNSTCKITKNITHLDISTHRNHCQLGKKIIHLKIYGHSSYFELPKHLSSLKIYGKFSKQIVLPRFLSFVSFDQTYLHPCVMDHLAETVRVEGFSHCVNIVDNLPNNLKIITLAYKTGEKQIANIPNFTKIDKSTDYVIDYVRNCF